MVNDCVIEVSWDGMLKDFAWELFEEDAVEVEPEFSTQPSGI